MCSVLAGPEMQDAKKYLCVWWEREGGRGVEQSDVYSQWHDWELKRKLDTLLIVDNVKLRKVTL